MRRRIIYKYTPFRESLQTKTVSGQALENQHVYI